MQVMTDSPRYPPAPRVSLVERLHGVDVSDPFRSLEDAAAPATVAWVDAENALTRRMLDGPHRDSIVARLRTLHRHTRRSVPTARGNRLFFTENDGTRNQAVLYVRAANRDSLPATPGAPANPATDRRVLVDPNALDPEGTVALTAFEPDRTGSRVVYALSRQGSDLQELAVHDIDRGVDLPDVIRWVKFASIAWKDSAFFYTRYPEPGTVQPEHESYGCQVRLHHLGDSQDADRLVYARPDVPEVVFTVDVTSDGRHLIITSLLGASDKAEVHVIDMVTPARSKDRALQEEDCAPRVGSARFEDRGLQEGERALPGEFNMRALVTGFTDGWHFIDGFHGRLYFLTDEAAPRGRIVRLDLEDEQPIATEVVAEGADRISMAAVAGGRLLVASLRNACSRLQSFDLDGGEEREVPLPGPGTVVGIGARWSDPQLHVGFSSFTIPATILSGDSSSPRLTEADPAPLPIDPAAYVAEQVWYSSKDGTLVSMFLVHRSDAAFPAPVLLTGYGGFDISQTPAFDPSDFVWLDAGNLIAVPNLRGGGEYGETWHEAGTRERKQNVFDDFIAAAEWLISSGRSSPGQVAIEGGSNGGLLVGAVEVQRPDLFGAVVCRVPVADMLRYHLFTVGRFWIPEYGCADDPQQFGYLFRYSPYHNVRDGVAYPPTLVMTADTDDRVAPGLAKKFAARLQEAVADGGGPILLRVDTRAGHGAGKPITKQIDEQADIYEFLFQRISRMTASEHERR
jgi:prolyl oligopeptidase